MRKSHILLFPEFLVVALGTRDADERKRLHIIYYYIYHYYFSAYYTYRRPWDDMIETGKFSTGFLVHYYAPATSTPLFTILRVLLPSRFAARHHIVFILFTILPFPLFIYLPIRFLHAFCCFSHIIVVVFFTPFVVIICLYLWVIFHSLLSLQTYILWMPPEHYFSYYILHYYYITYFSTYMPLVPILLPSSSLYIYCYATYISPHFIPSLFSPSLHAPLFGSY